MKLGIIATQADGGDTNAALLFDEIVSRAETRPASVPPPQAPAAMTRSTTSMLRAARAAGPRITSHRHRRTGI